VLKELIQGACILIGVCVALYFLMADVRNRNNYVYYDCTMASFHPDIPPKVKEACQNRHRYEQDQQNGNRK
jgi:hypothetical protein